MVVIIFMTTIITTKLLKKEPESTWPVILGEFNDLIYFARQAAIANQNNYRLLFKSNKKDEKDFVVVEQEEDDPEKTDKKIYKQVDSEYFQTKYNLPKNVKMEGFYRGKKEQFEDNKGIAYCYIIPNGLVQDAMIYLKRKVDDEIFNSTLKVIPFLGRFEFYEEFLKPERLQR